MNHIARIRRPGGLCGLLAFVSILLNDQLERGHSRPSLLASGPAAAYVRSLVFPGTRLVNPPRERIFNVPVAVLMTAAVIGLVHAVFVLFLNEQETNQALLIFGFIPARYDLAVLAEEPWWIGWGAAVWTFVTYAFLHANLTHLFINMVWLLAFGTPVARRFGSLRFAILLLAAAVAGAAAHLAVHLGEPQLMIGASAAISGAIAAALRFVFQRGGPLGVLGGGGDPEAYRVPALPLSKMLRDRRALAFMVAWFGINLLFGPGTISMPGMDQSVAWEAHIGGFLAGLFGFSLLDPVRPSLDDQATTGPDAEIISEGDKP
jgi:membrane associated rhomboid family serine protease